MSISRAKQSTIKNGLKKSFKLSDPSVIFYPTSGLILNLDAGDSSSYPGTGTTWFDISGNGNNGSMVGVGYGSGNGGYMEFAGTSYVNCGANSSLNITSAGTINIIFNPTTWPIGSWASLLSKGDTSYRVQNYNGNPSFDFGTSGLSEIDTYSISPIAKNNWYMVTSVFDGSSKKIYINGVLDRTVSVTGTISTNAFNLYLGENSQATNRYFNGKISVAQVYNTVLNQSQITQSYNFFRTRYL